LTENLDRSVESDARILTAEELLSALHNKFCSNFEAARPVLSTAKDAERQARALSSACKILGHLAGDHPHQVALGSCLDEIFADSMCAIYLACSGLNVPARMLLRRSLELGLLVAAYWDSAANYWGWREHDKDVRFSELCDYLQSDGYRSLLAHQRVASLVDTTETFKLVSQLYSELSDVVHPKARNFSTAGARAFEFRLDDLTRTLSYAVRVHSVVANVLCARFAELQPTLLPHLSGKNNGN
jgi:hypothetical protein